MRSYCLRTSLSRPLNPPILGDFEDRVPPLRWGLRGLCEVVSSSEIQLVSLLVPRWEGQR